MKVTTIIKKMLRETEQNILARTGVRLKLHYENKLENKAVDTYQPNKLPLDKIKKLIANELGIDDDMLKKTRSTDYVRARNYYMYWLHIHTKLDSTRIGNRVKKTHATVLYSLRKLKEEFELYPFLKLEYTHIETNIKQLIEIKALQNEQLAAARNN